MLIAILTLAFVFLLITTCYLFWHGFDMNDVWPFALPTYMLGIVILFVLNEKYLIIG